MGKTWSNRKSVKKDAFKMKGPKLIKGAKMKNSLKGPNLDKKYSIWDY